MRVWPVLVLSLTGCQQLFGFEEAVTADATGDAPVDTMPVPPDTGPCASFSSFFDTCAHPRSGMLDLPGDALFDTDTGEMTVGGTPVTVASERITTPAGDARALLAERVVISGNLVASGSLPFAIVATDSITLVGGVIDVGAGGAGAQSSCIVGVGANGTQGAGGGGGAGFGAVGGSGGVGDGDAVNGNQPRPGGTAGGTASLPDGPLGGCAGAAGGNDDQNQGGRGGLGGGAVFLVAGNRISIDSTSAIDAAGEGGQGGTRVVGFGDGGGGGGGSGGMILLEAPALTCAGTLAANGGGGGEGSGDQLAGAAGQRGPRSITRALGGSNSSPTGSDGGRGGARDNPAGDAVLVSANGGGGGGGGGVGFIRVVALTTELVNTAVSPNISN